MTGGIYRPGSTGRTTQFGSSDSIQVSSADSVRRASFSGGYGDAAADAGSSNGGAYGGNAAPTAAGGSAYGAPAPTPGNREVRSGSRETPAASSPNPYEFRP